MLGIYSKGVSDHVGGLGKTTMKQAQMKCKKIGQG